MADAEVFDVARGSTNKCAWGKATSEFAADSPVEEAVCCELVSEVKIPDFGWFWMIPEP